MTRIEIVGQEITVEIDGVRLKNVEAVEVTREFIGEPILKMTMMPYSVNKEENRMPAEEVGA